MKAEDPKESRLRLFVALDLPEQVREGLARWGRSALADPALRPSPPESLHVTLAFLGHRPLGDVARIAEVLEGQHGPAPTLELLDPVPRPTRGRPRLFAVPIRSAGVEALQAALGKALRSKGLYEPEKRPFWPHVTVARVRAGKRGSKRPMRVAQPPARLPREGWRTCVRSVRVVLYRSDLKVQGASYTPLAQIELPRESGRQ